MSGVLEAMVARIAALEAAVAAMATPAAAAAAAADPFASLGTVSPSQPPPPANVTGDQITALITPHIDNPAIKEALGAEMRAMGINALPETQPNQFAELYGRFQGVISRLASAVQGTATAGASII